MTISPQSLHVHDGTLFASWSEPVPKWLGRFFILFVATLPLETLQVDGLTSANFTISKLAGFLFFAAYLFYGGLPLNLVLPRVPKALWWFLAYLVVFAATALFSTSEVEGVRSYVMRLFKMVQFFVLFWLGSDLLRDPSVAKKSLLVLSLVCSVVAIGTTLSLEGFAQDFREGRATAFDASPNHLSALMAYAAIIIGGFCVQEARWSKLRKFSLALLILPLAALMISSGSRAGIGAFFIGMCCFLIPHFRSRRQMLTASMALAALAVVLYLVLRDPIAAERWTVAIQEGNTAGRGDIYAAAWQMIVEQPFFGWGREGFVELGSRLGRFGGMDAHNFILYLLIEAGLLGAVPFLFGLWLCLREAWRGRTGQFGLLPLALIMALLTYNMTHTGTILKVFWLILAFAMASSSTGRHTVYRRIKSLRGETPSRAPRREFASPVTARAR